MKLVKVPSPMRLLCGGALAYWLAHIINPAFVAIAVMIVLFIPIFITDSFSERLVELDISQQNHQFDHSDHSAHQSIHNPADDKLRLTDKHSSSEILKDSNKSQAEDKHPANQRARLTH